MSTATAASAGYRERLIAALAEAIEQRGYRDTSVAEIVRIARTSRRTFYEHFPDREACFLALFEETNDDTMRELASAIDPQGAPDEQVDRALEAYLQSVMARPALHWSFVRELPGLGPEGAARQRIVVERFAELLVGLVESGRRAHPELEARPLQADMAVIIIGGVRELMVIALQQGRDIREVRRSAADAVKAILNATVL